jgi:hypothetical protein
MKRSDLSVKSKATLPSAFKCIHKWHGREDDYVEAWLDGEIRYIPLNNSFEAYAQAFNGQWTTHNQ